MNGLSLCSGIGSLDLGIRLAEPSYRTVCYVEREAYASAVLVKRMEEGRLDKAPIWDSLETFDGKPWRGVVDIVVAGLPCQPYSIAGRKQGDKDERYIWPEFFRILREVRPALVFLENVPELLTWFRPVGEELSGLGYDFKAGLFTASEVGAPHKRQRLFVMAHAQDPVWREPDQEARSGGRAEEAGRPGGGPAEMAHTRSQRWGGWSHGDPSRDDRALQAEGPSGSLVYPQEPGLEKREAGAAEPGRPEYPSPYPPGPEEHALWDEIYRSYPELSPAVGDSKTTRSQTRGSDRLRIEPGEGEGLASRSSEPSGGSQEETQPPVRRMAHGASYRVDRLRACGNAVVPQTAALAWKTLSQIMGEPS